MAYPAPLVCWLTRDYIHNPIVTGKYPCLICEIPLEQMAVQPSLRKRYPLRSLESIKESHKQFMTAGGKRKKAKNYMNCVTEPIFDIPIDQVHKLIDEIAYIAIHALSQIGVPTWAAHHPGHLCQDI